MLSYKWKVLCTMICAISMIYLDQTMLPVALPTIQKNIKMSTLALHWLVNGYLLSLTAFVLPAGRLSDIVGHRKIFVIGLLIFAVASALCAVTFAPLWFIISRILQGIGAALLLPSSSTLLFNAFPENQRGKAVGLYMSIGALFLVAGPFIGGLFSEYLSWRYLFWINIPITLIALSLTFMTIKKSKRIQEPFDLIGSILLIVGTFFLIIGLMEEFSLKILFPGCLILLFFFLFERRMQNPLIPFALFYNRLLSGSFLSGFLSQFLVMLSVFWTLYFQNILQFSPAEAGMLALASTLPVVFMSPLSGFLVDKIGAKIPASIGFLLIAIASFLIISFAEWKELSILLPILILFGSGLPMIFTSTFVIAMNTVSGDSRGIIAGLNMGIRQLGGTLGMALMGATFLAVQSLKFSEAIKENNETEKLPFSLFEGLFSGSPSATEALQNLSSQGQTIISSGMKTAYLLAFTRVNQIAIGVALLGATFAFILLRKRAK